MNKIKHQSYLSKLLLFCAVMMPFMLTAQVTINAQLPPGSMIQKEQLWNLTLINNQEEVLDVNIKLSLQDAITGEVILSANTGNLLLSKGIRVITSTDVQPVIYHYTTADLSRSFLPMGNYIACYQIYYLKGETEALLNNECIKFNIDPLSPPLLSLPADKSNIETTYPLFTWMPPTPLDMFSNLNYDIIVTEVLEGQSATEAIEYNTPFYSRNNLTQPTENYAASFTKLERNKIYAWQVIAKNGAKYAVKTAVWTFTINKEDKPAFAAADEYYLLLENDLKGTYNITSKNLHIKYVSFDITHVAPIIFSDINGNEVLTINKKCVPGDNYFDIDLKNNFKKGDTYTATIKDMAGNSQALLFSIKK